MDEAIVGRAARADLRHSKDAGQSLPQWLDPMQFDEGGRGRTVCADEKHSRRSFL